MEETFEEYRPLLFSIAYRMLGSVMEAEDMIQETYLRYQATPHDSIRSLKAFLTTVITRLCINHLKSAKVQRETYIGPWLPEPVLTDDSAFPTPDAHMETYDSISIAFLVLLESLSPLERAVFLLREVFDYSYAEIADILEREESTCRKLFSRAKKQVAEKRPRFERSAEKHQQILHQFLSAVQSGQLDDLTQLLADDAVLWTDGGGKVTAAIYPVQGAENIAKFTIGTTRMLPENYHVDLREVNGQHSAIVYADDEIRFVIIPEIYDGQIQNIHLVANPDKLHDLL